MYPNEIPPKPFPCYFPPLEDETGTGRIGPAPEELVDSDIVGNYVVDSRVLCSYCKKTLRVKQVTYPNGLPYCRACVNLFASEGKVINDAIPNTMNPEAG